MIIGRIFTSGFVNPNCPLVALILIIAAWLYQFAYESGFKRILELTSVRIAIVIGMILYLIVLAPSGGQGFIYQQF